jgi:hypothetical protein
MNVMHLHRAPHVKTIHAKKKNASNGPFVSYRTPNASFVLSYKFGKIFATHVGLRHKNGKTCVWVSKSHVTNLKGPNSDWVPKSKA